jgi:2'-5' RNA ligase
MALVKGEIKMKYYIAVELPENLEKDIIVFQSQWANNALPAKISPHITVKAPIGLTSDEKWIPALESVCRKTKAFPILLKSPGFFGEDVLFLEVESAPVHKLHCEIAANFVYSDRDASKFFEKEKYHPHISLGMTWEGMSKDDIKAMYQQSLVRFAKPILFMANHLTIFRKEFDIWEKFKKINFTN